MNISILNVWEEDYWMAAEDMKGDQEHMRWLTPLLSNPYSWLVAIMLALSCLLIIATNSHFFKRIRLVRVILLVIGILLAVSGLIGLVMICLNFSWWYLLGILIMSYILFLGMCFLAGKIID